MKIDLEDRMRNKTGTGGEAGQAQESAANAAPRRWTIYVCPHCEQTMNGPHLHDTAKQRDEFFHGEQVEVVEASHLRAVEEAASFALACIPPKHPEPCGTGACWLCAAESRLREALASTAREGQGYV